LKDSSMTDTSPHGLNRRDFFKLVSLGIGGMIGLVVGLPALDYLIGPSLRKDTTASWIPLVELADIPIGVPTFFTFIRQEVNGWEKKAMTYGVFAVRKDAETILVLSNICTHLSCHVGWHADLQQYVSPCHNGHFDIVGNVLSGPPPRPLDAFKTRIEAGKLFIQYPPYRRS